MASGCLTWRTTCTSQMCAWTLFEGLPLCNAVDTVAQFLRCSSCVAFGVLAPFLWVMAALLVWNPNSHFGGSEPRPPRVPVPGARLRVPGLQVPGLQVPGCPGQPNLTQQGLFAFLCWPLSKSFAAIVGSPRDRPDHGMMSVFISGAILSLWNPT